MRKNKMLTRIYGTAYTKNADLEAYVTMLEEAKKRITENRVRSLTCSCFRKKDLVFRSFAEGMVLKETPLMQYWRGRSMNVKGVEISTPVMLEPSFMGNVRHWDHYKENMYTTVIDDEDFRH